MGGATVSFDPWTGRYGKGGGLQARRLLGIKAKAAALGKDHLELASRAEEMRVEAVVKSIADALASWDARSLQATTKVTRC